MFREAASHSTWVLAAVASLALAGCGDDPTAARPGPPSGGQDVVLDFSRYVEEVAPALARNSCSAGGDCHGAGLRGTPPGPSRIELFARDRWSLLDHLQVDRCHVVGFSLGGAVALEMALQQPSRAQRLVMINAIPSYRVDHWRKWLEAHLQINLVRWVCRGRRDWSLGGCSRKLTRRPCVGGSSRWWVRTRAGPTWTRCAP